MVKISKKNKGFTLIEMMVVLVIIGILIAVAVPNIASYIRSGNITADAANLKTLDSAAMSCWMQNRNIAAGVDAVCGTPALLQAAAPVPFLDAAFPAVCPVGGVAYAVACGANGCNAVTAGHFPSWPNLDGAL